MRRAGRGGPVGLCRVTDHLFLSNARAAGDHSLLRGSDISCVVDATEPGCSRPPPVSEYIHIPVTDSPDSPLGEHFHEVADKIHVTSERGGRTLVHCNAGVSRSAALCLAYLVKHRGMTLLEAHGRVKSCRPLVRPNRGFWKQLIRFEMELRGCNTVRMVSSPIGEIPDIYEEEARHMIPLGPTQ
ncbi:dual specificity protein phosphatase 18 [Antennarius striatus]|uniref:dual specificity protein phosphatase 18 n=1 Tax=Antennarius striatus TaxID=241820 RepID=UPI0035B3CFFC